MKVRLVLELQEVSAEEIIADEQVPEECKLEIGDGSIKEGVMINIFLEDENGEAVDINSIHADDPRDFIDQGIVLAIAEQLASGITNPMGTSIERATQAAKDKMESAMSAASWLTLKEKVHLIMDQDGGHC